MTRTKQIHALRAKGWTYARIAKKLGVSTATVQYHTKKAAPTESTKTVTDTFRDDEAMAHEMLTQADRMMTDAMSMQSEAFEVLGRTYYMRSKAPAVTGTASSDRG